MPGLPGSREHSPPRLEDGEVDRRPGLPTPSRWHGRGSHFALIWASTPEAGPSFPSCRRAPPSERRRRRDTVVRSVTTTMVVPSALKARSAPFSASSPRCPSRRSVRPAPRDAGQSTRAQDPDAGAGRRTGRRRPARAPCRIDPADRAPSRGRRLSLAASMISSIEASPKQAMFSRTMPRTGRHPAAVSDATTELLPSHCA